MKFKMTREMYVPKEYKEFSPEIGDYPKDLFACYVNIEQPHNPRAIFFTGKQSKPTWRYRFSNIPQMKEKINETISRLMSWENMKKERKAKRQEALKNVDRSSVKIGDIFHWSGGYNCTRNHYVRVVGFTGKKVNVVDLSKTQISGDWMNGEVGPVIESVGKERTMVIRPAYDGGVLLRDPKEYQGDYYRWNGKPNWENCD